MAKSKKKEKTLEMATAECDYETVIEYYKRNRNKRNSYSFSDEFQNLPKEEIEKIFSSSWILLTNTLNELLDGKGNTAEDWASFDDENLIQAGCIIHFVVEIGLATLQKKLSMARHVELALILNGLLSIMPNKLDEVKNDIAHFCEGVSSGNREKAELYLHNVFPYLFERTLRRKSVKSDVKRIYNIRQHLEPVMNHPATRKAEMWNYFEQILLSPLYLQYLPGQKVIALSLTIDIDKLSELHQMVVEILPTLNVELSSGYGVVYFKAWCYAIKLGKPEIKDAIEITCLQQFIEDAIRSKKRHVLPITRKILGEFQRFKKEQEVSEMLHSLYQPILWRYLKNPDGRMRSNAVTLFLDIFPFEEANSKIINTQNDLNLQLNMLRELLEDDFPIVRITTVLGMCISVSVNWEVYPDEMLKTYFRIMVNELARDSTHPEVRNSVIKGMKCLLENPLSLRTLVKFLPKLNDLFNDISETVRITFCQLLLRVKTISAIKFFEIVKPQQLIARLAEDCPTVQKCITKLLCNSYFPLYEDPKVWLGRCLEILKTDREASRVLFTHMYAHVDFSSLVLFICQATKALNIYVKTKNASCGAVIDVEIYNKENIVNLEEYLNNLEEAVGFNNLNTVITLMESIVILWLSVKNKMDMQQNKTQVKSFVSKMGSAMGDICIYYKDTEAWESVFYTASFLPPAHVPGLGSLLFWKLKNLPPDAKPDDYVTLIECLCNQRRTKEMLNLFKEWLEFGLNTSYLQPPPVKKRKRGKSVENVCYDQPKPHLANEILDMMLTNRCHQKSMLSHPEALTEIVYLFDHIKVVLFDHLKRKLERFNAIAINETNANFLGMLMYNILRILLYLQSLDEINGVKFLNEIVEWTMQKLIPHLTFSDEGTDNFTSLVHFINMSLCRILGDLAELGYVDPNSKIPLSFFEQLLTSELGYKYALITARFLYKYTFECQYKYASEDDTSMYENLFLSFDRIIENFDNETLLESIPTQDYKNVQFTLGNVMQHLDCVVAVLVEPTTKIFKFILSRVIDSVCQKTKVIAEELSDESFEKISFPKVGAFFNFMVNLKPKLAPLYMKLLTELYKSSSQDISQWIAYYKVLDTALNKTETTGPFLNETNVLLYNLGKTLCKLYPKKKSSRSSISKEPSESPEMQLFQQHCHAEFLKLKNLHLAKVKVVKLAESQE